MNPALQSLLTISALFGVQLILGRKAAFPYGLIAGFSPFLIGIVALVCDLILALLVRMLIDGSMRNLLLRKQWERISRNRQRQMQSKSLGWLLNLGKTGVLISMALPFTGGVYTASALGMILGLKRGETFRCIILGSIAGSVLFICSSFGFLQILR